MIRPVCLQSSAKGFHSHLMQVYNQIVKFPQYKQDIQFYTIGNDTGPDTWIISVYSREDYGMELSISAPASVAEGTSETPESVKTCLSLTDILPWNETFVFFALAKPISKMISEISILIKKNARVNPCYMYTMDQSQALHAIVHCSDNVVVKKLTPQDASFISSSWQHAKPGTFQVVSKSISVSASSGVFLKDGPCVSGCVTLGHGFLGSLFTLQEHRGQRYAKLATMHTLKQMASDGCIPCSLVQIENKMSVGLHDGLGMTRVPQEVYIMLIIKADD